MRVEREGDAAAWLAGTLVTPNVQGQGLSATEVMALSSVFFEPVVPDDPKASWPVFLHSSAHSGT